MCQLSLHSKCTYEGYDSSYCFTYTLNTDWFGRPSQAFIIALTSDFIPRLVYTMAYSPDGSLKGYVNQTLAVFNTSDFDESHRPVFEGSDSVESCR